MPCPQPDRCSRPRGVSPSIAVWHVVISGFTQHRGDVTGSQRLWLRLRALLAGRPEQTVEFFPWHADWRQVAEWIFRCAPDERPARVCIYAYSWGAGYGFVRLARELQKRGIRVRRAVLCDPVYHAGCLGLLWLALSRLIRPVIVAPANVDWVWSCFQNFDRWPNPRGHRIVAANPLETIVCTPRELERTHHYMDESPEWQEMCASVACATQLAPRRRRPIAPERTES